MWINLHLKFEIKRIIYLCDVNQDFTIFGSNGDENLDY